MQIIYSIDDLRRLVEKDLVEKRIKLLATPTDLSTLGSSSLSCEVEFGEIAPSPPVVAPLKKTREESAPALESKVAPAPKLKEVARNKFGSDKSEEQKVKDREYQREWAKAKRVKEKDQQNALAIVSQALAEKKLAPLTPHLKAASDDGPETVRADRELIFQKEVLAEIEELKRATREKEQEKEKEQEVVAPAITPFRQESSLASAEALALSRT